MDNVGSDIHGAVPAGEPGLSAKNSDELGALVVDESAIDHLRAEAVRELVSRQFVVHWDVVEYIESVALACPRRAKQCYNAGPNFHVASKSAYRVLAERLERGSPSEARLHPGVVNLSPAGYKTL